MKELINDLRNNSRIKLVELSKKHGIPLATVHDRVKKFETNGPIKRYVTLLNYQKIGYPIRVNMTISSNRHLELYSLLSRSTNVNNCFKTKEAYIVELIFPDLNDLENFKQNLEKIESQYSLHFVLEEIKKEEFKI